MQTNITRFAFDMRDKCVRILEFGKITKNILNTHIERLFKGWDFVDARKSDGLVFDRESSIFFHDTDDEDSLGRDLETVMEFSFSTISDHSTIDRDEFVLCIFIRLTHILFAKFEDLAVLEDYDLVLRIAEIISIARITTKHMSESIDRNIILR